MLPSLEYIKQTRQKLGITQRRLASLTGISTLNDQSNRNWKMQTQL